MNKQFTLRRPFLLMVASLACILLISNSCKKIDEGLDELISFDGIYSTDDGWEVDLNSSYSNYTKVGTQRGTLYPWHTPGAFFMSSMVRVDNNTWRGDVRADDFGISQSGEATIIDNRLTITPDNGTPYTLYSGSNGSGGGGGGGGTPVVLVNVVVSGDKGDRKYITFNVPDGVTYMEVNTRETAPDAMYNAADMFVREGADPVVLFKQYDYYTWTADCSGTNINREQELCTFTNPGAGEWTVLLFCPINSFFFTNLVVTITK